MKKILLILLFAVFYTSVNAQCSITATTNASALTCGTAPLSSCGGILYIGDGTNAMSLNMNQNLDLECLGAIQLIVRNNGTLDFSGGNYDLKLASGSSVILQSGSNIYSGGGCSASDRIYIGGSVVANCNGSGSIPSFADVIANGGINQAGILSGNQYICTSGTTTTTFSSTSSGGTWSSGSTSIATVNSSTGVVTALSAGTATITYTKSGVTATRTVYVASSAPAQPGAVSGTTPTCPSLTGQVYSIAAVSGASSYTWTVPTGWTITAGQGTTSVTVTTGTSSQSGNLTVTATNACGTSNATYYYVYINTAISTANPSVNNISGVNCGYAMLTWNQVSNATGYYLDIATDSGFTNFVAGYQNYNVAYNNGSSPVYNLPNGTSYFRIRAYDSCKISNYSNTGTISMTGSTNSGTLASSQTICSGTQPANLVLTGNSSPVTSWESSTDISFSSRQTIASTATTLTGAVIGNLTQSTYFRAVTSQMTSAPWCNGYSTVVLITVINTISVASSSPTPCINTAMTNITHTTSGFTGIGTPTGLPAGVSASFSNNTITISGTPTASGTFNYSIPLTGGSCGGSPVATGTITVRTTPATPGTITQPTNKCAGSTGNIFSITAVTGATSYTWSVTGTGWSVTGGQGTVSATITIGSGAGTVSVTATNTCGTSSASTTGSITPNAAPTITAISSPSALCPGGSLNPSAPTVTANGSTVSATGWQISTTSGGSTYTALSLPYTVTYADNAKNIRYYATNGCGTTYSNVVAITVNNAPTVAAISSPSALCSGGTLNPSAPTVTNNGSTVTASGWEISTTSGGSTYTALSLPYTVAYADNGKNIRYYATNGCGTTYSNVVAITVNNVPTVAAISSPSALCSGGSLNPSAPTVTNNGSTVSASGWEISTTSGGSTYTALSLPYTVAYADNGKNIRYYATNGCGTTYSNVVAITVNNVPTVAAISSPSALCPGGSLNPSAPTVTANGSTVSASGWEISTASGGSTYTALTLPYTVAYADNGKNIRYYATNGCGTTYSNVVAITVNPNLPASVSIAASPTGAICSGTSVTFTATPTNPGTTPVYQWKVNGTNAGTNSSTYTTTTLANNDVVTVEMTSNASPCLTGSPATSNAVTMTVNSRPTPTFTTATEAQTCGGDHKTYTSQSGQSNYVWTVSGVLNTDYRLIARGTSTDFDIVIEWLTAGAKTVTVNYNNSNGCNGAAAATYSTNVTVIDRGRVNGGAHICKGSSLPTLTLRNDAGNATYPDASLVLKWQYSDNADNSNWQDISGTVGQVSYTPTAFPGAFRTYQVILQSGNCTKTSIESRINIDAFNAPTIGTTTYPTCSVVTGSVVLTGLPSGNWTINQTGTVTASYNNTTANTTSYTINGLVSGTYTFTVTEGSCTSDASATLNMSQVANIWDGTKWSKTGNTTLPTADDKIVFEGNYTLSTNLTGCSCTVNSGNVVVSSGVTLTITNAVTVTGGTFTFENNASLVQINNVGNSGAITYKRISQPMKNFDYTYWSSPVAGQTFVALSPNTLSDKYMSFTGTAWKSESPSSIMDKGIGYIIRVPKPNSTYPNGQDYWTGSNYAQPVEFKGVPNNGNITSSQTMVAGNFYLVGNPYPSAMDADEFLFMNLHNRDILGGTIYFWTHNTAITPTGTQYKYTSDDYASYNLTGGTGTAASSSGNKTVPDGYIAAGQSFFASADLAGNVEFDNSMRVGDNNSTFFKPAKTSKSTRLEKHRLWLNMINSGGAYKQALIGYIEGATNSFDKSFDGLSFDGNSYIDFYSVNAADNYVIQGRALPFTDTDVVPLGYRSTVAGDFTIAIDHADGNLATQRVYLEDKQTGAINELTAGNYTFNTKAGTFNNRFVLRYTNKTLGTGEFETVEDAISILVQNKTVTIDSSVENIDKVFIYDITGKQLYTKDNVNNLQLIMQNLPFAQQVLLVKIFLENGTVTTKKVIFK
ncbi:T9SS sorting signal type C domain-containing protein [Flavobacterium ajazii]|uniref:T9SS sorting signal type C domain-containing protein n=1 Tax=Flavobacterium ajazii TaxID=2692318 RepID=UPI0013D3FD99|nr:T9SS sorting signal type C domain-containing protein [Flavobacterium ajazii]